MLLRGEKAPRPFVQSLFYREAALVSSRADCAHRLSAQLIVLAACLLLRFYAIWHVVLLFSYLSFLAFCWGPGFFHFVLGEIYMGVSLEHAWLFVC